MYLFDASGSGLTEAQLQVRQVYFEERRNFHIARSGVDENDASKLVHPIYDANGAQDARGKIYKVSVWPGLTTWLLDNGLEPRAFIRAFFEQVVGNVAPPPSVMMTKKALDTCSHTSVEAGEEYKFLYEAFKREVATRFLLRRMELSDHEGLLDDIIQSPGINAPAIYRYAHAVEAGREQVASRYYTDAISEYVGHRQALDYAVGDKLSVGFRQEAERLARSLRQ